MLRHLCRKKMFVSLKFSRAFLFDFRFTNEDKCRWLYTNVQFKNMLERLDSAGLQINEKTFDTNIRIWMKINGRGFWIGHIFAIGIQFERMMCCHYILKKSSQLITSKTFSDLFWSIRIGIFPHEITSSWMQLCKTNSHYTRHVTFYRCNRIK